MRFELLESQFGNIAGEVVDNDLFIHFDYYKEMFTKSNYTEMLDIWSIVLDSLKETGVKIIYTCVPNINTKAQKFQAMFGLAAYKENEQATIYRMEL
jgi:hypothetical protein